MFFPPHGEHELLSAHSMSAITYYQVLESMQKELRKARMWRYGITFSAAGAGGGVTGASVLLAAPNELTAGLVAVSILSTAGIQVCRIKCQAA